MDCQVLMQTLREKVVIVLVVAVFWQRTPCGPGAHVGGSNQNPERDFELLGQQRNLRILEILDVMPNRLEMRDIFEEEISEISIVGMMVQMIREMSRMLVYRILIKYVSYCMESQI